MKDNGLLGFNIFGEGYEMDKRGIIWNKVKGKLLGVLFYEFWF